MCIFLCKLVLIGLCCTCFRLLHLSLLGRLQLTKVEQDLEKGSEANVTEDGGNKSRSQRIKASKNGNTSTAARGGLDWEQRIKRQKFQALDDCNTSAMAQGGLQYAVFVEGGNTSAVAQGEPPKHVDKGAGSGSTVLPVHEGMLNEQASLPPVPEINFRLVSSTVAHLPPSAVRRGRLAPTRIPINVVVRGRWADKHQYKFHVEPNDHVTVLRELLAAQSPHLPPDYHFSSNRTVMDEFMSFRDNGIVGVGVPEIEVVDCTAKLPTDQV